MRVISVLTLDDGNIYGVTRFGTIIRESNGTWETVYVPDRDQEFSLVETDGRKIFALNDDTIWHFDPITRDTGTIKLNDKPRDFAIAGSLYIYMLYNTSLFFSTDEGMTWSEQPMPDTLWNKNFAKFLDRSTGFVTARTPTDTDHYLYLTRDGGTTWRKQPISSTSQEHFSRNAAQWVTDSIFVVAAAWSIHITKDGGNTWKDITPTDRKIFNNYLFTSLAFLPNGTGVALGANMDAYITRNFGDSWIRIHEPYSALSSFGGTCSITSSGTIALGGNVSVLSVSRDGGFTWDETAFDFYYPEYMTFFSPLRGVLVASHPSKITDYASVLFTTTNGGRSWARTFDFYEVGVLGSLPVVFADSSIGYCIRYGYPGQGPQTVFRTTNGGMTWGDVYRYELNDSLLGKNATISMTIATRGRDTVFVRSYRGLLRSYDAGATWKVFEDARSSPIPNSDIVTQIVFDKGRVGWARSDRAILRTESDGETWDTVFTPIAGATCRELDVLDPTTAYIWSGLEIYKTTDGGASWLEYHSEVAKGSEMLFFPSGRGIGIGMREILSTNDEWRTGATQFSLVNSFVPQLTNIFFLDERQGWVAGSNFILHTTDGGISWMEHPLPTARTVRLEPGYPNPSSQSHSVTIPFTVTGEHTARVRIEVRDLLGRNVATLYEELAHPGRHQVAWNTIGVSPGMYFIHLTGAEGEVRKVVVR